MRSWLKFLLATAVALAVMLAVRAWVFSLCTVGTDSLQPLLQRGDRVMVNRLAHDYQRGDLVLFGDSAASLGIVKAVPGDTIVKDRLRYLIPHASHGCCCQPCQIYLIYTGQHELLLRACCLKGKAYLLRRL